MKHKPLLLLIIAILLAVVAACGSPTATPVPTVAPVEPAAEVEITDILWKWEQFQDQSDEGNITVDDPDRYTLVFRTDGTVEVQADCNAISGTFTRDGSSLQITLGPSTMAACGENSLDSQFVEKLGAVGAFVMEDGKLVLNLMADAGNMVFANGGEAGAASGVPEGVLNVVWQWSDLVEKAPASQSAVPNPANYTITFREGGKLEIKADCNAVEGTYQWDAQGLKIELGASTLAFCGEDSLDQQFLSLLPNMVTGGLDGGRFFLESAGGAERMGFNRGE